MFRRAIRILVVAALLAGASWPGWKPGAVQAAESPGNVGAAAPKRILVVQSYDPDYVWCRNINQGIADALSGLNVTIDTVYLDAKRRPDPARLRAAASAALRRIEADAVPLVIAVDDVAQEYLVAPHLKGRALPQVIFCGVNAPLANYGYPARNVSGVRERWHFRQGFELLGRMDPRLRNVAFLGEGSESGRYLLNDLLEEMYVNGPYALKLAGAETVHTFQQWQERVRHWQEHADALALGVYSSLVDETTGQVRPPAEVMAWTNEVNRLPTLGFTDTAKEYGLLCGVLVSGHEQGFLAGGMARAVLTQGVSAGSLTTRFNTRGVVLLNLRTAERLGLRIPFELIEAAGVTLQ